MLFTHSKIWVHVRGGYGGNTPCPCGNVPVYGLGAGWEAVLVGLYPVCVLGVTMGVGCMVNDLIPHAEYSDI